MLAHEELNGHALRYKNAFIQEAEAWHAIGLYRKLAELLLSQMLDVSHPVHLDAGCGPGHLLFELTKVLAETSRARFTLIGVDSNHFLLNEAYKRLQESGVQIEMYSPSDDHHLDSEESKVYLIEDDLRKPKVLPGVLEKLGTLTSITHSLTGASTDMVARELFYDPEIRYRYIVSDLQATQEAHRYVFRDTKLGIYELANKYLDNGGIISFTSRFPADAQLQALISDRNAFSRESGFHSQHWVEATSIYDDITTIMEKTPMSWISSSSREEKKYQLANLLCRIRK